jgi:hypothetical protein
MELVLNLVILWCIKEEKRGKEKEKKKRNEKKREKKRKRITSPPEPARGEKLFLED